MVGGVEPSGSDRMRLAGLLRFAIGAFASGGIVFALSIHIPRYFATHVGIGLTAVGLAFTVVRLLDIAVDPVLGVIMDRTRTRLGRYRPWMLSGAPILMLSSYMLFMARPGVGLGYLIFWLLILYLAVSMMSLAMAAWAGTLSTDYGERAKIFGLMGAVGVLGSATVMLVPSVVSFWRSNDDLYALHAMAWAMIALLPLCAMLAALTPETLRPAETRPRSTIPSSAVKEYAKILWTPSMRRLICAGLALALGPGALTPIFVFYWRDARLVPLAATNIMLVMFMVGSLVGAPTWGWVASRIGKHRTIMISAVSFSLGQVAVTSLPKGSPLVFAGMLMVGFLISAFTLLMQAIMADVADEVRLEFGRERSGLLFAFITTTQKIGGAISISLTFWLLAWLGYDPAAGIRNTAEHLRALEAVYAFVPIAFILLGGAFFIGFPLDAERHAQIVAALAARESARDAVDASMPGSAAPIAAGAS